MENASLERWYTIGTMSIFASINEIAVLVSAILAVAVEHIWYSSLLFGDVWRKSAGLPQEEEIESIWYILRDSCFRITAFFALYTCVALLLHDVSMSGKTTVTVMSIFLFACMSFVTFVLREQRSTVYFFIHAGYLAISIFGGIGIIMFWPW